MSGFTTRPELLGSVGMVASTHWLASAVGMSILERGGNAFDATVATGLTLHVVEPHLNGLGGDAPIIGWDAASGESFVICGQGPAPAAASIEHFAALGLDLVPGTGQLPAVVPGSFGAWMELLARFGSLPLRTIMEPAIGYATDGFPLVPQAVATIETVADLFREHWTTSADVYLRGGSAPEPRSRWANPVLGATLSRILVEAEAAGEDRGVQVEAARRAFYEGFVADAVAEFSERPAMDSSGEPHAGLLTHEDLARWRPSYEAPLSVEFQGFTVCKTDAWGQGPVLLQQLALLDGLDLRDSDPGSAELIHTVLEGAKLAFADREAYYGDPAFGAVPTDELLSADYARERRSLISDRARDGLTPGVVGGKTPRLPSQLGGSRQHHRAGAGVGEPTVDRSGLTRGDTCHVDVADRFGNIVSATPSGGWLQSSPVIPALGFALPTRGQMFWLEAGLPNSLEPLKRPRTTLSPGLVLREGKPYLAFGTPGGDQQDQWTVPFLLNHLVYGMDLQEAIDAPSYHSTHVTSSFYPRDQVPLGVEIESRVGPVVIEELRTRGHQVTVTEPWTLGRISAAGIRADGQLVAAANARGMQGYAVGR